MKIKTIGESNCNYKDKTICKAWKKLCQKSCDGEVVPVTLVKSGSDFDFFGDGRINVMFDGVKVSTIPTGRHAADYADYTYLQKFSQLLTAESIEAVVVHMKNGIYPVIEVEIED